jgi:hypothetical protein
MKCYDLICDTLRDKPSEVLSVINGWILRAVMESMTLSDPSEREARVQTASFFQTIGKALYLSIEIDGIEGLLEFIKTEKNGMLVFAGACAASRGIPPEALEDIQDLRRDAEEENARLAATQLH